MLSWPFFLKKNGTRRKSPLRTIREFALKAAVATSDLVRYGPKLPGATLRVAEDEMDWVEGEQEREGRAARPADGGPARAVRSGRVERGEAATGGLPAEKVEVRAGSEGQRIFELEMENLRLTRLVADLLLKNQRLRESN